MNQTDRKLKENLDDEGLILLIKAGKAELYEIIMRRYNQKLYRTAVSFGISDFDCDDVIQQAYINAYEKIEQFRGQAKFSTWLTRILINECLMFKRKRKTENRRFVDDERTVTNLSLEHQTPEEEFINEEMKDIFEKTIKNLPEKFRSVYILREIEKTSVKECAEILNISEVNVKVRLLRAKNLLKKNILKTFDRNEVLTFGNERCDAVTEKVMNYILVNSK